MASKMMLGIDGTDAATINVSTAMQALYVVAKMFCQPGRPVVASHGFVESHSTSQIALASHFILVGQVDAFGNWARR